MIIILYRKALVSPLPDMAAGMIMLVIAAHMACHKPLHELVETLCHFRLNKQMKMIRHQTPGKDSDWILFFCCLHEFNERTEVAFLVKDLLSAVTTIDEVVVAVI